MDQPTISLTAVHPKSGHGYVGFLEELPGVNSDGRTIEEARTNLHRAANNIFELKQASGKYLTQKDLAVSSTFTRL